MRHSIRWRGGNSNCAMHAVALESEQTGSNDSDRSVKIYAERWRNLRIHDIASQFRTRRRKERVLDTERRMSRAFWSTESLARKLDMVALEVHVALGEALLQCEHVGSPLEDIG